MASGIAQRLTVIVQSEFGRRLRENTVFLDGFETGDRSRWTRTFP